MLTLKQEAITIPNVVLVGATTVNYSRQACRRRKRQTFHVGDYRLQHALAAGARFAVAGRGARTPDIIQEPAPRVLQRSLSDFYVEYQLLFRIPKPEQRLLILSELHAQIHDTFNEFGVQIMSPHFEMQPAATVVVPKTDWHKPPSRL